MKKNSPIIPGKVYRHHKDDLYTVLHVVDDSTNARAGNKVVVYVSLTYGTIKCRDVKEFTQIIIWPDGKKRPRFVERRNSLK